MERNESLLSILGAIGAGAALVYFLDPNRGARRRAGLLNKASSVANKTPDILGKTGRDLSNRAYGLVAQASSAFTRGETDDLTLERRVRSAMGRVVSHPRAIYVSADNGMVRVWGNILADEVEPLLACVRSVKGVREVENKLTPYKSARNIPDLQTGGGQQKRGTQRSFLFQEHWSPAERAITGIAGGFLIAFGAGLVARSISNVEIKRFIGTGGGRNAVTVEKAINVDAPPDVVFALWSNFENFPLFMSNVREVRILGAGRSHWVVSGPAGISVEWDAVITKVEPNRLIAWKSIEGSEIPNAGYVRFDENENGTTRVTARISYNPPAGVIGHAVAGIFGADPKTEMDQDLMRMKMLLETGTAAHDAAQSPSNTTTETNVTGIENSSFEDSATENTRTENNDEDELTAAATGGAGI
ncbi:MAG: SRPBCC family protein [Acidobacteriota bacterium]|nr:SRPBCC family protein [Acidobacteriota bacterium]